LGVLVETALPGLNEAAVKWTLYDQAFELYRSRPDLRFPPQSPMALDVRVTIADASRRAASTDAGEILQTFKVFPPGQRAAAFTIDQAMEKLRQRLNN
jgi:hypothetical protein